MIIRFLCADYFNDKWISKFILILLALDPMFKNQVEQRNPNMKKRLENLPLQTTIFVH